MNPSRCWCENGKHEFGCVTPLFEGFEKRTKRIESIQRQVQILTEALRSIADQGGHGNLSKVVAREALKRANE